MKKFTIVFNRRVFIVFLLRFVLYIHDSSKNRLTFDNYFNVRVCLLMWLKKLDLLEIKLI